jgi:hypothetical protein
LLLPVVAVVAKVTKPEAVVVVATELICLGKPLEGVEAQKPH